MVNSSDSLGPLADNPAYMSTGTVTPPEPVPTGRRNRVPWPDGRRYRHTDGEPCDAGFTETYPRIEGTFLIDERAVDVCTLHHQEIVLAPRFRHEEDEDGDCEATPAQVTGYPGEARLCTLHELPVVQVW